MKLETLSKKIWEKLFTIFLAVLIVESYKCDRFATDLIVSEYSKANSGKYLLEIQDKPDKYVPNEKYEITIRMDIYQFTVSKFKKFIISLESKASPDDSDDVSHQTGKFELGGDALSKFSHTCPNTVIEANSQPKREVSIIWIAPPPNSGCVTIKATVIESREKWYADDASTSDGPLTKTLCEDSTENEDVLPDVLDFCCACDEAKYEMSFQGNWIRNNHPKGFPEDLFTTKFSDIIGASHKNNQEFWKDGREPIQGLKELAHNGSTRSLESQLMDNIANLHTIIKARGLAYPNITSSSYAIFRVDNENHLVSMVTKIMPSPDWIVGVSSFELCTSNCSWKQSRTINLYPRDVGIDDALEYTGSRPSENENPIITEITSSNPSDPKSPFYDESGGQMKPIAKLHFKLEKLYKKDCDPDRQPPKTKENESGQEETQQQEEVFSPDVAVQSSYLPKPSAQISSRNSRCEIIGWTKLSSCSVQCGKGHMTRTVKFRDNVAPGECKDIIKEDTQECEAPCEDGEQQMEICPDVVWSQWSPCSVSCGKGMQDRYRIPSKEDSKYAGKPCPNKEVVECEEDC